MNLSHDMAVLEMHIRIQDGVATTPRFLAAREFLLWVVLRVVLRVSLAFFEDGSRPPQHPLELFRQSHFEWFRSLLGKFDNFGPRSMFTREHHILAHIFAERHPRPEKVITGRNLQPQTLFRGWAAAFPAAPPFLCYPQNLGFMRFLGCLIRHRHRKLFGFGFHPRKNSEFWGEFRAPKKTNTETHTMAWDYTINVMDVLALAVAILSLIVSIFINRHIKRTADKTDALLVAINMKK